MNINIDWNLPVEFNIYDIDLIDKDIEKVWVDCYGVNVINNTVHFHINSEIFVQAITHYSLNLYEYSEYFRNKIVL